MSSVLNRRWMLWVTVAGGWILIGLSFTLNYYLYADHYVAIFKKQPTLAEMMIWEIPYWILWAALSPLIFWITRRFRFDRRHRIRTFFVHLSAFLILLITHRAIYLITGWLLNVVAYREMSSIGELYKFLFFFNLPTGFMSYGTVLLVSYAVDYYNRYHQEELKASHLKAKLAEAQLQVTQAQLEALKMQLHPHFLFNTLNSISALLDDDVEAADEMLTRLGDFLRMTLENSGAQEITLQEELEFLRCYLEIERVRFQDRLSVRIEIDPETLYLHVPNLILQPIVENAIRHGIAPRSTPGCLVIKSKLESGALFLEVTDNGCGLRQEDSSGRKFKEGLGLANTRARLQQLYGAACSLEMRDAPGGGLRVRLMIPVQGRSVLGAKERVAFG